MSPGPSPLTAGPPCPRPRWPAAPKPSTTALPPPFAFPRGGRRGTTDSASTPFYIWATLGRRHADLCQQYLRDRVPAPVLVAEGPNNPPHALVRHLAPVEVEHVAPVLAVKSTAARHRAEIWGDTGCEIAACPILGQKAPQEPPDLE